MSVASVARMLATHGARQRKNFVAPGCSHEGASPSRSLENIAMKRIPALLLAAGAAFTAPAFAQTAYSYPASERVVTQVYDPATGVTIERTTVYYPEGVVSYD